jgi:hypothetical protein
MTYCRNEDTHSEKKPKEPKGEQKMAEKVSSKTSWLTIGIVSLLVILHSVFACAEEADTWQNEILIYGWYAGVDGDVVLPTGTDLEATVDASDIIDNLEMILMGGYEGRIGKWSVVADVVYMDVGDTVDGPFSTVAAVELDIQSWVIGGAVGYDVMQSEHGLLSIVGGARYLALDVDAKFDYFGATALAKSGSDHLWDAVIGMRGFIRLTDNWYLPYYADIGGGDSDLTYQLFAGVGYRYSWGDIRFGYKYLYYDLGDDKLMQDLSLGGPALGVTFRF